MTQLPIASWQFNNGSTLHIYAPSNLAGTRGRSATIARRVAGQGAIANQQLATGTTVRRKVRRRRRQAVNQQLPG